MTTLTFPSASLITAPSDGPCQFGRNADEVLVRGIQEDSVMLYAGCKRIGVPAGLVVLGLSLGFTGAEALLRVFNPGATFGAARELPWMRASHGFVIDPTFGFRPAFGDTYTETGTHQNEYRLIKSDSTERVLYIGDSVTRRGRIVRALQALYSAGRYEHWNAGVESFNTVQEVEYYKRYNRRIRPDHIILTLHNNDFGSTPVAFRDERGRLVVYEPGVPEIELNAALFQYSMIYRLIVGLMLRDERKDVAFEEDVREALARLKNLAAADQADLTVLVLPILKKYSTWSPGEQRRHRTAIRLLRSLGIRYFDLLPPLENAIASGVTVTESPGDVWHPGDEVARVFAAHLFDHGLFAPEAPTSALVPDGGGYGR